MMRVAIIGAGSMGHTHGAGWQQVGAEVVGIVAGDPAHSKPLADELGTTVYPDLDAILPHCDVVDLCVPTPLHRDYTLKAAAAHKHVHCEKPIGRTYQDGLDMIAACEQACGCLSA